MGKRAAVLGGAFSFTACLLAACGGGGGGTTSTPSPPAPPVSLAWGQMDPAFGVAGKVTVQSPLDGGTRFGPSRLTVGPEGDLYIAGFTELTKLDSSGAPAQSFAGAGRVRLESREGVSTSYGPPVADPDANVFAISRSGLLKFEADGNQSSGFGNGGLANVPSAYGLYGLARDSSGNLFVIPGRLMESASSFEVVKLGPDGRPSSSFGVAGKALLDVGLGGEEAGVASTFVDGEGNFYAAGWVGRGAGHYMAFVTKLDRSGSRVASFNPALGGVARVMPCNADARSHARDITVDSAGNVFVAGQCVYDGVPARGKPFVIKIDSRGAVDTNYRGNTSLAALFDGEASQVLLKANGEVVAAGTRRSAGAGNCGNEVVVAKVDAQGQPISVANGNPFVVLEGARALDLGIDRFGRLYVGTGQLSCSPHTVWTEMLWIYRLGS